jgi:hypothetical protein
MIGGSHFRWGIDEVCAEEGDDPDAGVASGRVVISGRAHKQGYKYGEHPRPIQGETVPATRYL